MSESFDGKPRHEILRALESLESRKITTARFDALMSVDTETRDYIVGKLEKDVLDLAAKFRALMEDKGSAAAKKQFTSISGPDSAAAINEEQSLTVLIARVVELRGADVDPLVKMIADEVAKISPQDAGTENKVYGAMFDAVEQAMQADGTIAKLEEAQRIEKLRDAFGWRLSVGIKEHFNKAGKIQEFAAAATDADNAEQKAALKGHFWKDDDKAALGYLAASDVFMRVARRVGSDEELAALLPAGKFDAKDLEILEKHNLPALAAVVKTAMGPKAH